METCGGRGCPLAPKYFLTDRTLYLRSSPAIVSLDPTCTFRGYSIDAYGRSPPDCVSWGLGFDFSRRRLLASQPLSGASDRWKYRVGASSPPTAAHQFCCVRNPRHFLHNVLSAGRLGLGETSSCVPVLNALADCMALTHRRQREVRWSIPLLKVHRCHSVTSNTASLVNMFPFVPYVGGKNVMGCGSHPPNGRMYGPTVSIIWYIKQRRYSSNRGGSSLV